MENVKELYSNIDKVLPFNEGYAMVMKDGKCGYIVKGHMGRQSVQHVPQ